MSSMMTKIDKFFLPAKVRANRVKYLVGIFVSVMVIGNLIPFVYASPWVLLPIGVLGLIAAILLAAVDVALSER